MNMSRMIKQVENAYVDGYTLYSLKIPMYSPTLCSHLGHVYIVETPMYNPILYRSLITGTLPGHEISTENTLP